jgi:hypothetical protein
MEQGPSIAKVLWQRLSVRFLPRQLLPLLNLRRNTHLACAESSEVCRGLSVRFFTVETSEDKQTLGTTSSYSLNSIFPTFSPGRQGTK